MIEPLGNAQPQAASSAVSATQRIDTATGDQSQPRSDLNGDQTPIEIGASIPLVFCRRRDDVGGVWLSPPAAEASIVNDLENRVTARYRLVVSDGEVGAIASSDVFQGDQRRGEAVFAYDGRAGDWEPGSYVQQRWDSFSYHEVNEIQSGPSQQLDVSIRSRGNNVTLFRVDHTNVSPGAPLTQLPDYQATAVVNLAGISFEPTFLETGDLSGKEAGETTQYFRQEVTEIDRPPMPLPATYAYCGDGAGTYSGLSSLSFSETYSREESEEGIHKRQVHVFVRDGARVERLLDLYRGASDLLPDLAHHLLLTRLSPELVDREILVEAARFCEAQRFRFNGALSTPVNLRDFLNRVAPLCLLTVVQREGAIGLRPAIPYNSDGLIYVGPTVSRCRFDEGTVVEGSFKVDYAPAAQRLPFVVEVLWRQQPEGNVGLVRATAVAYADAPDDAPIEQFDLSDFCADHVHAVKVAAAILSRRRHVTHTASLVALPGAYAGSLVPGDVVEVALGRRSSVDGRPAVENVGRTVATPFHRFYYQINSVATDRQGNVELQLTHWPVDSQTRSLVALDVANVDPGAVSIDDTGLPTPVDPTDVLFAEGYLNNYFVTLRFLPPVESNGFVRICVQASQAIRNGNLVLRLNIGRSLTILEGQTLGCVDVPIDGDLIDDLVDPGDLGDLTLDDLVIDPLDDLKDILDGLDGDTDIGDLDTGDLRDVLDLILDLDDLGLDLGDLGDLGDLDAGDLDGLTDGQLAGLDLGDLGDLTVDELEALLDGLTIDDLDLDLTGLDLTGLVPGVNGLVVETDVPGLGIDLGALDLGTVDVVGGDVPGGYEVIGGGNLGGNLGNLGGLGGLGSLDVGNLGGLKIEEDLLEEAAQEECVGPRVTVYFHSLEWVQEALNARTLVIRIRVSPTGVAPQRRLGPLTASVVSFTTVAYDDDNVRLVPQPPNLPTLSVQGPVALPWTEADPPPSDRIFQGEYRVTYPLDAFPPTGSGHSYKMEIAMAVAGGYCGLSIPPFLGEVVFEAPAARVVALVVTYTWENGLDLDTTTTLISPVSSGPVGWAHQDSTKYLSWQGDVTSSSGTETIDVLIDPLLTDYPDETTLEISLRANWYGELGNIPVVLTVIAQLSDGQTRTDTLSTNVTLVDQGGIGQSIGTVAVDLLRAEVSISA